MEQQFCVYLHITSTLDADVADNKSRQFYAWLIKIFLIRMIFLFRIGWSNYSVYIGTTTWPLERGQLIPHKLQNPVQIINFCWTGSDQKMHKLKECAFDVKLECDVSVFLFLDINLSGYEISPSQLAEISHREYDTELFSHSARMLSFLWHLQQKCGI